jgi:hypothetical protein
MKELYLTYKKHREGTNSKSELVKEDISISKLNN